MSGSTSRRRPSPGPGRSCISLRPSGGSSEFLARNPGVLVTRQALLKDIWGTEQITDTGYLRLYLSQLRKKLEADPARPAHLLTESGMGYRLVPDAPEEGSR